MEVYCEHQKIIEVDDESFLLDNENTNLTCMKCKQEWDNGNFEGNLFRNGVKTSWDNTSLEIAKETISEDHLDSPEDSPLLLNEEFIEVNRSDGFHCHSNTTPPEDSKAWKQLLVTALLCLIFMVTELVGGYIAGSLAVMTDAAHLFSDFVSFGVSIMSMWIAKWPATQKMTFGYYRAEVLGAFLSVMTIWLLSGVFCVLAIIRLWKGDFTIEADTMLYIASAGVVINIIMGAILHGACHAHSHSHTPNTTHNHAENINIRAAAAHVLGDLLQSLGVLFAAVIIKIYPDLKQADPVCTILFTIVVVCATLRVAKDSVLLLLEASPKSIQDLSLELRHLPGVKHLHNLHVWTLAPGRDAIAVHLAVDEYCDRDNTLKQATNLIKSMMNIVSCTIQIELYNAEYINNCKQCKVQGDYC